MSIQRITPDGIQPAGDSLAPLIESLQRRREAIARTPIDRLLALMDDFAGRLLGPPVTIPGGQGRYWS